eukprot:TRINITY_DN10318_c0_g1_i1.p1 TRINITY_DN10318_c0_g1~~TRINITY_DN10318_c0_g1_i1.p1  ORF type:complete len:196 (+),score=39.40 TRINITY_DN10318_c0_g1_i1:312-899(+)
MAFSFIASGLTHLVLIYLRSQAIFHSYLWCKGIIRIVMFTFSILVVLTAILIVILILTRNVYVYRAVSALALVASVTYVVIDVASTIAFAREIREVNLNSQAKNNTTTTHSHSQETSLIARRGVTACLCSSIAVVLFLLEFVFSSTTLEVITLLRQFFSATTGGAWSLLKIELDIKTKSRSETTQTKNDTISSAH